MVGLIFALAIINLSLGYVAAMALTEPPFWAGFDFRTSRRRTRRDSFIDEPGKAAPLNVTLAPRLEPVQDVPASSAAVVGIEVLPQDWLGELAAEGIVAHSFVEGVTHVLRLEVGRYRERLVAAEDRARLSSQPNHGGSLDRLTDELRQLNQEWLDRASAAADMLGQRAGSLGDHEQAAAALEQSLLDQVAQIRSVCSSLHALESIHEPEIRGKQLVEQIQLLLVPAHELRDRMLDQLATLLRAGHALEEYGPMVLRDATCGLPNRVGLEWLLANWWKQDPQRTRVLSAIMIDIDRGARVGQRLGSRVCDRAIIAVGRLIDETLPKDQGFERLVRIGGGTYFVLQGDVGPHQALSAAERLRQAIEATTFEEQGNQFDLTISCGVIEVGHTESSLDLIRRADGALRFAKKAGRNRCALDKGEGPTMLEPPQFPVKGRVVMLSENAANPASNSPAALQQASS